MRVQAGGHERPDLPGDPGTAEHDAAGECYLQVDHHPFHQAHGGQGRPATDLPLGLLPIGGVAQRFFLADPKAEDIFFADLDRVVQGSARGFAFEARSRKAVDDGGRLASQQGKDLPAIKAHPDKASGTVGLQEMLIMVKRSEHLFDPAAVEPGQFLFHRRGNEVLQRLRHAERSAGRKANKIQGEDEKDYHGEAGDGAITASAALRDGRRRACACQ